MADVDFVIDAFAKENLFRSLKVVKNGGAILSLLRMIGEDALEKAMLKNVNIHYILVNSNGDDMKAIADLLAKGIIKSHVSKVFPFDQMAQAHLEIETGRTVGKIVLKI